MPALFLAQGLDQYYAMSMREYSFYQTYTMGKESFDSAEAIIAEVAEEEPVLQAAFDTAQYDLDRANNREEYEERRKIFDDAETLLNNLMNKKNEAQEVIDSL